MYRSDISISRGIQRVFSYWAPYRTNFILGHLLKSYEIFFSALSCFIYESQDKCYSPNLPSASEMANY